MKSFFLILWIQVACLFSISSSAQCLTNGDFTSSAFSPCVAASQGTCGYFTTCNGWNRLQGTPQVDSYTYSYLKNGNPYSAYYIYMWAYTNPQGQVQGEGVFTPFTFQANHSYDIKIQFTSFSPASGSIILDAANGLTSPAIIPNLCGTTPPASPDIQNIGVYTGTTGTGTTQSYTASFTANKDYNQLWIYPTGTGTTLSAQYNLELLMVYVCPSCTNQLVYNTGAMPTGESAAGTILAGSSAGTGGSGIVTDDPNVSTTLTAATQITLLPNFQASAPASGSFTCRILPCTSSIPTSTPLDGAIISDPGPHPDLTSSDKTAITANRAATFDADPSASAMPLKVYPTISTGGFTITGSAADLANANILVTDESGRPVYQLHNDAGTTLNLHLEKLGNGIYFLQINNGAKTTTQKIIIAR